MVNYYIIQITIKFYTKGCAGMKKKQFLPKIQVIENKKTK